VTWPAGRAEVATREEAEAKASAVLKGRGEAATIAALAPPEPARKRSHIAIIYGYEAEAAVNTSRPWGLPPLAPNQGEIDAQEVAAAEAEIEARLPELELVADEDPVAVTLEAMRKHGWRMVLLQKRSKRPQGKPWQVTTDPEVVRAHLATGAGVGLMCGPKSGVAVLDFDRIDARDEMFAALGPLEAWSTSPSGGCHVYVKWREGLPARLKWDGETVGEIQRGPGEQQVCTAPTPYPGNPKRTPPVPAGGNYTWLVDPRKELPELPEAWADYLIKKKTPKKEASVDTGLIERALKMPGAKPPRAKDGAVRFQCPGCASIGRDNSHDNGCAWPTGAVACAVEPSHVAAIRTALGVPEEYHATDPGIAQAFFDRHKDSVRYDVDRGCWLLFDGTRWMPDALLQVKHFVIRTLQGLQADAVQIADPDKKKARLGRLIGCENRIPSILKAAEAFFGTRTVEWDTDAMLLGVVNGAVDLRSGTLRPGRPEDRITMQAAVSYVADAKCPLWEKTLSEIFAGDADLVSYIQRALGYSLTGDCREEVFFLATSALNAATPGREGKGTIINTVRDVLGDYSETLSFKALEQRKQESETSPDLAKLVHKRFVTASESSGGRFNEQKIKNITGRDPIACRFLHENEFTYLPEFKLWLSVNQLPKVRDEAFWSRPHRIPFKVSFRGKEDRELKDKLRAEREGILAWMVRGCLEWQKAGLAPPKAVTEAVEEYRLSQEPLAEFYAACCTLENPAAFGSTEELRKSYLAWCDAEKIVARLGSKRFSLELGKRFKPHRETTGQKRHGFLGIGLVATETAAEERTSPKSARTFETIGQREARERAEAGAREAGAHEEGVPF